MSAHFPSVTEAIRQASKQETSINEVIFYAMMAAKMAGDQPEEDHWKWKSITELYIKIAEVVVAAGYLNQRD